MLAGNGADSPSPRRGVVQKIISREKRHVTRHEREGVISEEDEKEGKQEKGEQLAAAGGGEGDSVRGTFSFRRDLALFQQGGGGHDQMNESLV